MRYQPPDYPGNAETLLATMAAVCAARGQAREVALLASAEASIEYVDHDNYDGGVDMYGLRLLLPAELFGQLGSDRQALEATIGETAREAATVPRTYIGAVWLGPAPVTASDWRQQAVGWLRGEGINNQGRVRSDNIAVRSHDGLLFRSQPEIRLYQALKSLGVSFAPLPVFVRGGQTYRRIEPDFLIVHRGVCMVVEVDGDTVHHETPAEAHDRTTMLAHEGVQIERVKASDCETPEKASACARRIVALIDKLKSNRQ
jgi:hypothetical protein